MEIKRKNPNKKKKLVGRGGTRGKTSGRGTKGQKARAGRKLRPEFRDIIKKLPKKRGYRFASIKDKPLAINLSVLEVKFDNDDAVNPITLLEKKIITKKNAGPGKVKILGKGEITKKVNITGCLVSKSVIEKVEKAGGKVS
jgi:large subunit ribosomal protein L15